MMKKDGSIFSEKAFFNTLNSLIFKISIFTYIIC